MIAHAAAAAAAAAEAAHPAVYFAPSFQSSGITLVLMAMLLLMLLPYIIKHSSTSTHAPASPASALRLVLPRVVRAATHAAAALCNWVAEAVAAAAP